jgi:hypothetical protein
MRYKAKVLARFPDATPVVVEKWPEGGPRYVQIWAAPRQPTVALDISDDRRLGQQGYAAAWRSAYFWCIRNPRPAGHLQPLAPGELLRIVRGEAV